MGLILSSFNSIGKLKLKRIFRAIATGLAILLLTSGLAVAYSYYVDIDVENSSGNDYTNLPLFAEIDNDYLADEGYIGTYGWDTRVTLSGDELPRMIADDRVLFAVPTLPDGSSITPRYTFGNSADSDMYIITGYGGNFEYDDAATLEIGDDFQIDFDGYIDTTYTAIPAVLDIEGGYTDSDETSHVVTLSESASGNLLLVFVACDGNVTVSWPAGWTEIYDFTALGATPRQACAYRVADGTEAATITVTTSGAERSVFTSYTISGYSGTPFSATWTGGTSTSPDPPSLSITDEVVNTLWFAIAAYDDGTTEVTAYPANYEDGRNDRTSSGTGVGQGIATRNTVVTPENPGTFTLDNTESWGVATVGINSLSRVYVHKDDSLIIYNSAAGEITATLHGTGDTSVTAINVTAGEHQVEVWADATNLYISIDGAVAGDSYDSTALGGDSANDNANDWYVFGSSASYLDYYKHSVGGTLIAWYDPTTIIASEVLPDREGAAQNGTITWGSNPVTVTLGTLVSGNQPAPQQASDTGGVDDVIPGLDQPSTFDMGTFTTSPIYPAVHVLADLCFLTDSIVWVIMGGTLTLGAMALCYYRFRNHMLLGGIAQGACTGLLISVGIFPWFTIFIGGVGILTSIFYERKPVV